MSLATTTAYQIGDSIFDDLPPFANEANRAMAAQVREKEKMLARTLGDIDEHKDRVKVMKDHLKSVERELKSTQSLLESKRKEIISEDHLKQLSEREAGRVRGTVAKLRREHSEAEEQLSISKNATFKSQEALENLRQQQNWNQEELEQRLLAVQQKEEDNLALMKYTKEDQARIKDLNLQIEKLTSEAAKRKAALDNEVTETQAAQIELDKTAENFRQLHKERQDLYSQCESAKEVIKARDGDIQDASERLAQAKLQLRSKKDVVLAGQEELDRARAANVDMEHEIASAERNCAKLKTAWSSMDTNLDEFKDEVEALRAQVSSYESDITSRSNEIESLTASIQKERQRLAKAKTTRANAEQELDDAVNQRGSLEARVRQLAEIHKSDEARLKAMDKSITTLKEKTFKRAQELFKLRQEEANMIAEITGAQGANKNLAAKIYKLDAEAHKQHELIYNQEFDIQQLERKVARAQGERTQEEKAELNAKIQDLNVELDKKAAEQKMVQVQLKKLELDLKAAHRSVEEREVLRGKLTEKIADATLDNESAQRAVKTAIKGKEDLMVQTSILKLELKKLKELLSARADEVFGLENRKNQLKLTMEEREAEIAANRDGLATKLKLEEAERHQAAKELRERETKIDKLRKKYEILLASMGSNADDEERSQAYYIIKAAQDKEELQQKGDALEAKIRAALKDTRIVEAALADLNQRNENLREGYRKADAQGDSFHEKQALEDQLRTASDKHRSKKREVRELEEELSSLEKQKLDLLEESASLQATVDQLNRKKAAVDKELEDQKGKLERALTGVLRQAKKLRAGSGLEDGELMDVEKDFSLGEQREFNRRLLQSLVEFAQSQEGLMEHLENAAREAGLSPSVIASYAPASRGSSRPSSVASSLRSMGSRGSSRPGSVKSSRSTVSNRSSVSTRSVSSRRSSLTPNNVTLRMG